MWFRKRKIKKVGDVLRGFLPKLQSPERIREVIQNDDYVVSWFNTYVRLIQEKEFGIPNIQDFGFSQEVTAYVFDLSKEEVSDKISSSVTSFDITSPEEEPHPIRDAIKVYYDVMEGKEPMGIMKLQNRFITQTE